MTKYRLIYRSHAEEDVLGNQALAELEAKCVEKNLEYGLTGMLILSGERFLQVIEGEIAALNHCYARIVADNRHRDVQLLSYEAIQTPSYDSWSMRLVDLYDLPKQPRRFLERKYDHEDGVIEIPTRLDLVYALLSDAKCFALSNPWS